MDLSGNLGNSLPVHKDSSGCGSQAGIQDKGRGENHQLFAQFLTLPAGETALFTAFPIINHGVLLGCLEELKRGDIFAVTPSILVGTYSGGGAGGLIVRPAPVCSLRKVRLMTPFS